tara:strand:+ start:380 stop:967 length:588 start_codon:yes stop_codon:yes gene_type:complete
MCPENELKATVIDQESLPENYPTHRHAPEFWESLGRVVASFGFLEMLLGKAIFALSATRPYPVDQIDAAYEKWLPKLERALTDPLGSLIESFGKAVREHPSSASEDLDDLLNDLRKVKVYRNVLCHGSWGPPDEHGKCIPFFVDNNKQVFETEIDLEFLRKLQSGVAELSCCVSDAVTVTGFRFPGSSGPGKEIQ